MSSIDYLNALAARGIRLWAQDGKLQYQAPKDALTPELLAELKQRKATLVALLEQFAGTAGSYPLSYAQKSLWSLHRMNPQSAAYNVTYAAQLDDALDVDALAHCVDALVARHPILRTRYAVVDGEPQQQVSEQRGARLEVEHVFDAGRDAIGEWIETEANRPFDLAASPIRLKLLVNRVRGDARDAPRHVLLLNVHHIAADFWSLEILVRELKALYRLALAQQPLRLPPLPLHYKDCVQHEIDRLAGPHGQALAAFWEQELRGEWPPLALPADRPRPPVKTENGRVHTVSFGEAMSRSVKEAARALQVTPYMLLLSVYQLFLFLHTGQPRLAIGAPTAGRDVPGSEQVLGHFVNTVVLACEVRPEEPFAALAARTRSMMGRVLDHAGYPFPLLVERLRPPRDPSRSPLVQVMYNWNQVRPAGDGDGPALFGPTLAASSTGTRGATHDLTLNVQDDGRQYAAAWTFNTDLFDESTVARFAAQYLGLVAQVLVDARQPAASYRMTSHRLRAEVLERIAQAVREERPGAPLATSLAWRAASRPEAPMWRLGERVLRRAEVAEAVQSLRARLAAQGVGAGTIVGVRLASVAELAVTTLALLALEARAFPVDAAHDGDAADAPGFAAEALVCGGGTGWDAWEPAAIAVVKRPGPASSRPREPWAAAAQIGGFIEGVGQVLQLDETSRPLLLPGIDLRLAVAMLAMTAACGASACVPHGVSAEALADGDDAAAARLAEALDAHAATTLAVPALLLPRLAGVPLARLRSLMAYGEHAHPLERLAGSGPALRFVPASCFASWTGPVAFTPGAAGWVLEPLAGPYPVPVLLGPCLDLADEHQAGRLHLLTDRSPSPQGGVDLAARFRRHGDLASAFMHHRLVETPLVLTRRAGRLMCADPTARVAPHRLEPFAIGPVERVLVAEPGVREAVCSVQETPEGAQLVAHVALQPDMPPQDAEPALRRRLKQALPESMHPVAIGIVERLPLAANGMLDASRLPPPQARASAAREASGDIERRLAAIWREVLARESVGVEDDFFALGGDSILAAVIVSKAGLEGLYIQPRDLFEHTTIAALAQVVARTPQIEAEQGPVTGDVAPGPAAAWFFDRIDVDRSHFNQALLVGLREAPDAARMQEALRLLARQHDVLRSRFVQDARGWRQVFDEAAPGAPDFAVVDCTGPDGLTRLDAWQQAIAEAQAGLDIERGPLWRVRWLAAGTPAESRLLVVVHHLLVDGISWGILLQDLADIDARLAAGAAAKLPLKTSSAKAWVEQWLARAQGDAMAGERQYWTQFGARVRQAVSSGTVALMRHGGGTPCAGGRHDAPGSCAVTLDAELTAAFRQQAHQAYGTDADDLLVAALHAGFEAWGGSRALLVDVEGHGRDALAATADLGRTVGWFTSIHPVLVEAPGLDDPAALVKRVKERLREVPGKGAGFGVLRYLDGAADAATREALAAIPPSPVLFTYLGALDGLVARGGLYSGVVEPAPGIRSARQPRTHLLDVCAYVVEGRLTLECTFGGASAVEDSIGTLMERVKEALERIVRHCCSDGAGGLTPSDVPDLGVDQEELDALLEEVAALER